ncbi:MAG: prephenate dehydrogenase [Chloroflexi bacterium]|nr:prephenate dehydrogenase [Chloroflexota bacterium]MCI0575632.1 prephenate dehydrogenase [Chloroflexota bacterium]MCI0643488.1 prephenate dehydrogenase [Chloroflexota bacterium]MCI0730600.1 prephenate dehydrogenase [Chloroflexota bacterium]
MRFTNDLTSKEVCLVGLGLMGGSLALALRPHVARLVAVDVNLETCRQAVAGGIVDQATPELAGGVATAGLVVLATPVRTILRLLAELPALRPDGCLVLDLGSTKEAVGQAMAALPATFAAIGGHPMCGRETAGLASATAGLYQGQTFVLCRNSRTNEVIEEVALALVAAISARPLFLPAGEHDNLVATSSHLPYLVATLLMQRAAAAGERDERLWPVSASGFRDTSRLAGSDPQVMLDILLTNRAAVLAALQGYQEELAAVLEWLAAGDEAALAAWLAAAQAHYQEYRSNFRRELADQEHSS